MLYTDGLVERRGQPLDAGIDAAAAAVTERVADHPDLVADHVMSAMTPAAGYDDDVAALDLPAPARAAGRPRCPPTTPPAWPFSGRSCGAGCRRPAIGSREASDIMIAAGEATANAVEHATAAARPARRRS